jgi:hypothetical protein
MKATKKQMKHLLWLCNNDHRAVLIGLNIAQEALDFNPTLTYSELTKEIKKRKKVYSELHQKTKVNSRIKPTSKKLSKAQQKVFDIMKNNSSYVIKKLTNSNQAEIINRRERRIIHVFTISVFNYLLKKKIIKSKGTSKIVYGLSIYTH